MPGARGEKVKKLSEIAEALRQGKHFPVTRLTTIKGLCGEPEAAAAFALFLAQRIQKKMRQEQSPKRYRELVNRAVKELKPYLTDPTEERKARLSSLCREMEAEQNEYKKIGWNLVDMGAFDQYGNYAPVPPEAVFSSDYRSIRLSPAQT